MSAKFDVSLPEPIETTFADVRKPLVLTRQKVRTLGVRSGVQTGRCKVFSIG